MEGPYTKLLTNSSSVQILASTRVHSVPDDGSEAPVVGHVHGEVNDGSASVGEDVDELVLVQALQKVSHKADRIQRLGLTEILKVLWEDCYTGVRVHQLPINYKPRNQNIRGRLESASSIQSNCRPDGCRTKI